VERDEVARALYAAPPADFVERRDALVREARGAGDAELATELAALRKPTQGAWLANMLAREYPDQVAQLLDLGRALRDAQDELDPDQIRELGRQRGQVVAALVLMARRRSAELGQRTGDAAAQELEETLTAALADPDAADALLSGTLAHGLAYAGLGFGVAASSAAAPQPAKAASPKPVATARQARPSAAERERSERIDAAERTLAQARLQAAQAQSAAEAAEAEEQAAKQAVAAGEQRVQELGEQLSDARDELGRTRAALTAARKATTAASREAAKEAARAERAARDLDTLRGG
jgi:hypothetical protein